MEKNHRLFIRNLPSDITDSKLHEIFDEHGTVTNIDIKGKLQNDGTKIAFINITATERQLNTCCRNVNSVVLGAKQISVQVAKESFLDRLKREREEAAVKKDSDQIPISTDRSIEPLNIKIPVSFNKTNNKKTFSDDTIESLKSKPVQVSEETAHEQYVTPPLIFNNRYDDMNYHDQKTDILFNRRNKKIEEKKPKELKVIGESEQKRLASLKKQKQAFKTKEQVIRNALKTVDTNRQNKIIFDDDIEGNAIQRDSVTKLSLFNNDDNDEGNDLDFNANFNEKRPPKFQIIGGDERFKMDERFFDNDDNNDNKADDYNEESTDKDEFAKEKQLQLEVLRDVLGKPIAKKDEKNTSGKRKNQMIRYDPNENNHRNYEIEDEKETPAPKKKRQKIDEAVIEKIPPVPVSNDIFYSVSNTLTQTLKAPENFSLLKTYGSKTSPDAKNEHYETQDIPKKQRKFELNFDTKNPFKYDSSDDEDDNRPNPETPVENSNSKLTSKTIPLQQCDLFFFIPNDPRFKDAEEFLQAKSMSNESFKNVRRELKQIVRSKIRNNMRKNQPWKKKIMNVSQSK